MTFKLFMTIILFMLFVFQALQIHFFKRKQMVFGGIFVAFFWITFAFLFYNISIIFSTHIPVNKDYEPKVLIIEKGSTLSQIGDQLFTQHIIRSKNHFLWTAKILGLENRLQAGKYHVAPYISNFSLIKQLTSGGVVQEIVTIIEGITSQEIASILSHKLDIDSTQFMNIVNDRTTAIKYGFNVSNLEGYLFPDTYHFNWGVSEREVVETLVAEFKRNIVDSILVTAQKNNLTLHELVTLASIIEGEAVVDEERSLISSVFHNRLKKNLPLEADPTIQYIIQDGPRRLLNEDLEIDSPYNTYKYKGLPPGPINNPGLKSLLAAAYPDPGSYLFFVATGDGKHTFTRTLAEHLQAKKKLDQIRRDVRR